MFTPKFTFVPTCVDGLSNIRSGISKQAALFVRHNTFFMLLWVSEL